MQEEKILHDSNQQENSSESNESTGELESDDEMCAYEKLRARNIAERQKKFQEYKLANLVTEVSSSYKSKKITSIPKNPIEGGEVLAKRIMPSRNCKPKNYHESEEDKYGLNDPIVTENEAKINNDNPDEIDYEPNGESD